MLNFRVEKENLCHHKKYIQEWFRAETQLSKHKNSPNKTSKQVGL